jgi:DNA-binding NtrC family response regulator
MRPRSATVPRLKVLIVDDEPNLLLTLAAVLSEAFEVTTATNGEDAWKLVENEEFQVVCTDLIMPGMDGITLLRALANRTQFIGRVLVTGVRDDFVHANAARDGLIHAGVFKPHTPQKLIEAVERAAALVGMKKAVQAATDAVGRLRRVD